MLMVEVIGSAISSIKVKKIDNTKLKLVKVIDPDGKKNKEYFMVEDAIGVGVGEKVLISDNGDIVSAIVGRDKVPIRASIIAKIDSVNIEVND